MRHEEAASKPTTPRGNLRPSRRSSRGNDTRTRREVTKRVSFLFFFLEGEDESSNRCYPTLVLERFANPILLLGFIKKKLFYFW